MVININPNRINTPSRAAVRTGDRRPQQQSGDAPVIVPNRADVNIVPAPESLQTLIRSAVAALRTGVFWDRGTILNLLA